MKYIIILILSLLCGYGSEIAAYYTKAFHPNTITILGSIRQFEVPCPKDPMESQGYCTHRYLIPKASFQAISHPIDQLGFGVIISASTYSCIENPHEILAKFDDPKNPGRLFDTLSSYQVINRHILNCQDGIEVRAYSRKISRRQGLSVGLIVAGDHSSVERVKLLSDFFTQNLITLSALFILILHVLGNLFKTLSIPFKKSPFEYYLIPWLIYLITSAGLAQIIFPITRFPQIVNRLSAIFGLLCHISPILVTLQNSPSLSENMRQLVKLLLGKKFYQSPLFVLFGILMMSPNTILYFAPVFMALAVFSFFTALWLKDAQVTLFSLGGILMGLKYFNVDYMPHPQLTTFIVSLLLLEEITQRFATSLKAATLIQWIQRLNSQTDHQERFHLLFRGLLKYLETKQCRLFILREDGTLTQLIIEARETSGFSPGWDPAGQRGGVQTPSRPSLTRAFRPGLITQPTAQRTHPVEIKSDWIARVPSHLSKVLATGQPEWHLIDPKKDQQCSSQYYSNITISSENRPVAVLQISGYSQEWAQHPIKSIELQTYFKWMSPYLLQQVLTEVRRDVYEETAHQVIHDLRSPLMLLKSIKSTCQEMPLETQKLIQDATDRIGDLCESLKWELRKKATTPIMIAPLLQGIFLTKKTEYAHRKELLLELELDIPHQTQAWLIDTDFQRILSNLINNAVEAVGDRGRIQLRSKLQNKQIAIDVIDNGRGIDPICAKHLGARGYSHGKQQGSGLGLYHAFKCIQSWGGNIQIRSKQQDGTHVQILLPLAE